MKTRTDLVSRFPDSEQMKFTFHKISLSEQRVNNFSTKIMAARSGIPCMHMQSKEKRWLNMNL